MTGKCLGGGSRAAAFIALSLALGCGRALPSRTAFQKERECKLVDSATYRTQLPDGRPVFLERRAFAQQGARYLVLGEGTAIDSGGRLRRARVDDADAVGVLLDPHGVAKLVPQPPGTRLFESPKILRSSDSGTDVLWLDPADSANVMGAHPARIMTARYDGKFWGPATVVTSVSHVLTSAHQVAEPTDVAGGVGLAVVKVSRDSGRSMELLVKQNGIWSHRPVVSRYEPRYPAIASLGSTWFVAFVGVDTANALGLFLVRSTDAGISWSVPYRVAPGGAYEPQLLALGQGLALVWVGERGGVGPLGVHVAFSSDGANWTIDAASNAANDSTTAAVATAFGDSHIALVRLTGRSHDAIESVEIVSRTARDVLWTTHVMALEPPLVIKDESDALTLLTSGARGPASALIANMTLSRARLHCR